MGHQHKFFGQFLKGGAKNGITKSTQRLMRVERMPKYRDKMEFIFEIKDDGLYDCKPKFSKKKVKK